MIKSQGQQLTKKEVILPPLLLSPSPARSSSDIQFKHSLVVTFSLKISAWPGNAQRGWPGEWYGVKKEKKKLHPICNKILRSKCYNLHSVQKLSLLQRSSCQHVCMHMPRPAPPHPPTLDRQKATERTTIRSEGITKPEYNARDDEQWTEYRGATTYTSTVSQEALLIMLDKKRYRPVFFPHFIFSPLSFSFKQSETKFGPLEKKQKTITHWAQHVCSTAADSSHRQARPNESNDKKRKH